MSKTWRPEGLEKSIKELAIAVVYPKPRKERSDVNGWVQFGLLCADALLEALRATQPFQVCKNTSTTFDPSKYGRWVFIPDDPPENPILSGADPGTKINIADPMAQELIGFQGIVSGGGFDSGYSPERKEEVYPNWYHYADGSWQNVGRKYPYHPATKVIEPGYFCTWCGEQIPAVAIHFCE